MTVTCQQAGYVILPMSPVTERKLIEASPLPRVPALLSGRMGIRTTVPGGPGRDTAPEIKCHPSLVSPLASHEETFTPSVTGYPLVPVLQFPQWPFCFVLWVAENISSGHRAKVSLMTLAKLHMRSLYDNMIAHEVKKNGFPSTRTPVA